MSVLPEEATLTRRAVTKDSRAKEVRQRASSVVGQDNGPQSLSSEVNIDTETSSSNVRRKRSQSLADIQVGQFSAAKVALEM